MEKITKEIMKVISKNLMIEISEQEATEIYLKNKKAIEEIEKIKEYDFVGIEPLDFPEINVNNDFREDVVIDFENKDKLIKCAKETRNRYIKV